MKIGLKPHYVIREATINDALEIRKMHTQSWRDTYQNDEIGVTEEWLKEETNRWLTDESMDETRKRFEKSFSNPTEFYRIAELNNEIVGLLHLMTKDDGAKHLWGLYTAKDTHGTGLAQQLMSLADVWIGDCEVDLEVASYNGRAKAFYRKCGFLEVGETGELFRGKIPVTRMIRKAIR